MGLFDLTLGLWAYNSRQLCARDAGQQRTQAEMAAYGLQPHSVAGSASGAGRSTTPAGAVAADHAAASRSGNEDEEDL